MKSRFAEPEFEVVRFGDGIITTSGCSCFDGAIVWGEGENEDCPNLNDPNCSCGMNTTNPALGNCV